MGKEKILVIDKTSKFYNQVLFIDEVKKWGVVAYVPKASNNTQIAYVRLQTGSFKYVPYSNN